jgi:hypothetical protein
LEIVELKNSEVYFKEVLKEMTLQTNSRRPEGRKQKVLQPPGQENFC